MKTTKEAYIADVKESWDAWRVLKKKHGEDDFLFIEQVIDDLYNKNVT